MINPPFASSVDRSRDNHIAAKHLIAAAKRLAPGGRLVAIMPPGFTLERDAAHWSRACGLLTPRLALTMPGQVYRKLGTSVETQLMVFDKVQEDGEMIRTNVRDLDEALAYVDAVAATRTNMRRVQQAAAIPNGRPTVPSSAPRKTAGAPVAASKPRANAVRPLSFTSFETPRDNTPISDIYARYRPQRIEIAGAQEHPTPLVESIAMASVAPPMPSNTGGDDLRLPARLIEEGHLSEAQLETIIMAHDAHGRDLPGWVPAPVDDDQTKLTRADDDPDARAYRLGYFLGDGTGCGKGRECAGLILVNWLAGRRKAIWVSKSATLIEDAIRDWTDLGGSPADIHPLSKWKPDQPIPMGDGILFVTYATLRSAGKCGTTRLSQILDWMGEDFEGVLAFDEAHAMQNAAGSGQDGGQTLPAGPRWPAAATGSTPRSRLLHLGHGCHERAQLGLCRAAGALGAGPRIPLPKPRELVSAMEAGGVAAMEVVARDLKTLGLYTARALSFDGVQYDVLEHALTPAQIEIYDAYAAFRTIHHNLEAALTATGVNDASGETNASAARASAKSRFESTKQRFFNHLLMGMKAPTIIRAIKDDLAAGKACVIQVVSTGESLLKRRLEAMDPEDELVEGALTPRDYVLGYLEQAFPIHAQKLVEIDGNMVAEPLRDETGALVVSREALALRDAAMMELMTLAPIPRRSTRSSGPLATRPWQKSRDGPSGPSRPGIVRSSSRSAPPAAVRLSTEPSWTVRRTSLSSPMRAVRAGPIMRRKRRRTRNGGGTTCWSPAGAPMRPSRGSAARIALPRSARRSSGSAPRMCMAKSVSPRRLPSASTSWGP